LWASTGHPIPFKSVLARSSLHLCDCQLEFQNLEARCPYRSL
jgi:hypothetical protein